MRCWTRRLLWALALLTFLLLELSIRSLDVDAIRQEGELDRHEQRLGELEDLLRNNRYWHWEIDALDEVWI